MEDASRYLLYSFTENKSSRDLILRSWNSIAAKSREKAKHVQKWPRMETYSGKSKP